MSSCEKTLKESEAFGEATSKTKMSLDHKS